MLDGFSLNPNTMSRAALYQVESLGAQMLLR